FSFWPVLPLLVARETENTEHRLVRAMRVSHQPCGEGGAKRISLRQQRCHTHAFTTAHTHAFTTAHTHAFTTAHTHTFTTAHTHHYTTSTHHYTPPHTTTPPPH